VEFIAKKIRYILRALKIRTGHFIGLLTHKRRKIPDFLIIGAQKGGTSSLYTYLKSHPEIKSPLKKEIHFFDIYYSKGLRWYKAHFPFKSNRHISGEASPDYVSHPEAPSRIKALNPDMKLILLVRDPIVRAYSAYQMNRRMGIDPRRTFDDAIHFELEQRKYKGDTYDYDRHNFFYLERGLYGKQLESWCKVFDRNQFLVMNSKNFFTETKETLKLVYRFLDIEEKLPHNLKAMNVGQYPPLSDKIYESLKDYYREDAIVLKKEWQIEF